MRGKGKTVQQERSVWRRLKIGKGRDWSFLGKPWTDGEGGLLQYGELPWSEGAKAYEGQRTTNQDLTQAVQLGRAYVDFEAEFEFQWGGSHNGAGFLCRAQDPMHYYLVHFEAIGQCIRAEHFWATVSKVAGNGWAQVLHTEMIHGVATEVGLWHKVRVVAKGREIRVWVDGRPMTPVVDGSYRKPGYVGLETWGYWGRGSLFRELRVRGKQQPGPVWVPPKQPAQDWFLPYPVGDQQQGVQGIVRAEDASLLMVASGTLVRSTDQGRTWAALEGSNYPGGELLRTRGGRLLAFLRKDDSLFVAESKDDGKTWGKPKKAKLGAFQAPANAPGMKISTPGSIMELRDGTLLGFLVSSLPGRGHDCGFDIWEWGTWSGAAAWSVRSTDGGRTWSSPVPLNGPPAVGQKYDLCETSSNVETKEGNVLSLVRPIYSPWMWEIWSQNGGESWGPATSGPFGCWAATALATADGTLLVSGRNPGLGLYVSHDSGMTWRAYRADVGGLWAMGSMFEVKPGLVFYVYMDIYGSYLRAQYLRITKDGAEPVRELLPAELQ